MSIPERRDVLHDKLESDKYFCLRNSMLEDRKLHLEVNYRYNTLEADNEIYLRVPSFQSKYIILITKMLSWLEITLSDFIEGNSLDRKRRLKI